MSFYSENCEERGEDAERLVDMLTAERDALKADLASMTATMLAMREQRERYADERDALRRSISDVADTFHIWFGDCGCGEESCPTCNVERAIAATILP